MSRFNRFFFHSLCPTAGKFVALVLLVALSLCGEKPADAQQPQAPQVGAPAPDFDGGTDWLNTTKGFTLADLRGRIVLLDFWTLC